MFFLQKEDFNFLNRVYPIHMQLVPKTRNLCIQLFLSANKTCNQKREKKKTIVYTDLFKKQGLKLEFKVSKPRFWDTLMLNHFNRKPRQLKFKNSDGESKKLKSLFESVLVQFQIRGIDSGVRIRVRENSSMDSDLSLKKIDNTGLSLGGG